MFEEFPSYIREKHDETEGSDPCAAHMRVQKSYEFTPTTRGHRMYQYLYTGYMKIPCISRAPSFHVPYLPHISTDWLWRTKPTILRKVGLIIVRDLPSRLIRISLVTRVEDIPTKAKNTALCMEFELSGVPLKKVALDNEGKSKRNDVFAL